jgi:hypothetical protein
MRYRVALMLLVVVVLGGCAWGPAPSSTVTVTSECERNGGVWFAPLSQCVIGAGGGGGM